MNVIKLNNIELQGKIVDADGCFRLGFCREIQEYVMVVTVFWIATYERYYRISGDDYRLYQEDRLAFIAKYQDEMQSMDMPLHHDKFLGSAALRDYDCVANLSSLIPYPDNPFNGHVYIHGRLWACIHTDTDVLFVPPTYCTMMDCVWQYPMRELSGVRLVSLEIRGQMQPVCYCLYRSELLL